MQKKQINNMKKQLTSEKKELKKVEKVVTREDHEREQEIIAKVGLILLQNSYAVNS